MTAAKLIGGIAVGLLVLLVIRDQKLKSGFDSIALGMPLSDVTIRIGVPEDAVSCCQFGGDPAPGCVKEFSYLSLLSFTDVWVVSFNFDDRVIRKVRYRSP